MGCVLLWAAAPAVARATATGSFPQQLLFALAAILSVVGCLVAARITARHERLAWSMMAVGAAMMATGDLAASLTGGALRQPLSNAVSLPGILWLAAYVPYVVAFSMFLQSSRSGGIQRARRLVDLALLVLVVTICLFGAVLFPIYGNGAGPSLVPTLLFFGSVAASLSLLIHLASTRPKLESWHRFVFAALVVVCAGSVLDVLANSGVRLIAWGDLVGLPWFLGYVLVAAGGFERFRCRSEAPRNVGIELGLTVPGWGTALTAVFFVFLPIFVYEDAVWVGDRLGDDTFSILIAVTAIIAIGRNLLIAVENSSLRQRSATDPLTGLFNHRHFQERLKAEVARAGRTGSSLGVVVMDVDDFDRVNNVYGHAAGDRRLRSIAGKLLAGSRSSDVVCRVGGDEFAIVLPETDPIEAYRVCMRLQDQIREPDGVCPLPTAISMGIACLPEHAKDREDLIQRADGALYWAKYHGREQIVIYDPNLVRSLGPEERIAKLEAESYLNMVQLLSSAVDARDPYTERHSRRVAETAVALALDIGLDEERAALIETAALLHDVGKIGVPDAVLRKPDVLTFEERELVKEHPLLATRILGAIPHPEILPWIAAHHERWDGDGYPAGLAGEAIPLESRIIALADAFDAMISPHSYRPALSRRFARLEIERCSGTQFDPRLTKMFAAVLISREADRGPR